MPLQNHLATISDFRRENKNFRHQLIDILMLSVMATLSGASDFEEIAWFGQQKITFLKRFLALPNGIPSHDTIRRVWMHIDPQVFNRVFMAWVAELLPQPPSHISIDGKTMRGSATSQHPALHIVSAVASELGISLAQVKTQAKSNEITAVPALLELLALKGCLVTLDAMSCQTAIAQQIIQQQGDYILAVKANQPTLLAQISKPLLAQADGRSFQYWDKQHSRVVEYRVWVETDLRWIDAGVEWAGLSSLIRVQTRTHELGHINEFNRFYISSLPNLTPRQAYGYVRGHWAIENQLHWQLDVTFREDGCQLGHEVAAQNMSLLRKIALNLLSLDPLKVSKKKKLKRMAWDDTYLETILDLAIKPT